MSAGHKLIIFHLQVLWVKLTGCLSAAQCPDEFTLNPEDSFCYLVVRESMTWTEARNYCHGLSGDLAQSVNAETHNFISQLLDGEPGNLEYWIGANDVVKEGEFRWIDYNLVNLVTMNNMDRGQPNGGSSQNCVVQVQSNTWHDRECENDYPSVCEMKTVATADERHWIAIDPTVVSHRHILREDFARSALECARFCLQDVSCDIFAFNAISARDSQDINCFSTQLSTEQTSVMEPWTNYETYLRQF